MIQFRFAPQMWAARPHLGSIFEKLLHQKTFQLPAARIFEQSVFIKAIVSHETLHKKLYLLQWNRYNESIFFEKTICNIRQKGVPPLLLPASLLQLPRCLVRICNLFHINHKITNLTVSKNAIAAGKTILKNKFASQMWATRPHLGSIFEKLLHRKTF